MKGLYSFENCHATVWKGGDGGPVNGLLRDGDYIYPVVFALPRFRLSSKSSSRSLMEGVNMLSTFKVCHMRPLKVLILLKPIPFDTRYSEQVGTKEGNGYKIHM